MVNKMKILESAENYLETILILHNKKGSVRSIDIANELEYSKPSVSIAMKRLRENGYIDVKPDGYIELTETGKEVAESIYERHTILTECLTLIGVSKETAEDDACKVEHIISEETFSAIKDVLKKHRH